MPTNNFKLFDQNKANLLSDTEYLNSTQRLNGVQTGVASSQLNNKFAYQVSLVAYAIAQIMNQNNLDASDTLSVSAFVGNLGAALLQKVADKASSTEAAAGVLNNKYITPVTMKAAALLLSGGTMSGVLNMGNNKITNLGTPTADSDAATKGYVDGRTKEKIIDVSGSYSSGVIDYNFGKNIQFKDYNEIQFRLIFVPSQQFVINTFGFYLNDNLLLDIAHSSSTQYINKFQSLIDILKINDSSFIVSSNNEYCTNMIVNQISIVFGSSSVKASNIKLVVYAG